MRGKVAKKIRKAAQNFAQKKPISEKKAADLLKDIWNSTPKVERNTL